MEVLRSLASTGSTRRCRLPVFGLLLMLISGLLAMHVLSMSGPGAEHGSQAVVVQVDHAAAGLPAGMSAVDDPGDGTTDARMSAAAAEDGPECTDDCGTPMPNHSMLMMGCVLALLAGGLILLAPMLLGRLQISHSLAVRALPLVGTVLPRPRPPSLTVLSISRT